MTNTQLIKLIEKEGKKAVGKKEFINFLKEKSLLPEQTIKAMCYSCTGYFIDGKQDCKMKQCPLYRFMPYRDIPFSDEVEETTSPVLKKRSASK